MNILFILIVDQFTVASLNKNFLFIALTNTASNIASSLRASIQNVRDARAQFLAAMHDVSSSLPQPADSTTTSQAAPAVSTVPAPVGRVLTPVDQDIVTQMISMGFSPELAREAVLQSPPDSLEQAVEYCFNHPTNSAITSQAATASATISESETISAQERNVDAQTARPVIEQPTVTGLEATSASTITDETSASTNIELMPFESIPPKPAAAEVAAEPAMPGVEEEEVVHQLDKAILDKFANSMLPGLMKILDNVPETVYRVCELIVVVVRKYGDSWRDGSLMFILEEICDLIKQVNEIYSKMSSSDDMETTSSNKSKHSDDFIIFFLKELYTVVEQNSVTRFN